MKDYIVNLIYVGGTNIEVKDSEIDAGLKKPRKKAKKASKRVSTTVKRGMRATNQDTTSSLEIQKLNETVRKVGTLPDY